MHLHADNISLYFPDHRSPAQRQAPASINDNEAPLGGIRCSYRGQHAIRALHQISLRLGRGDRLALIGHNGSGKSTLLRALAGIYTPQMGRISRSGPVSGIFNMSIGFRQEATGRRNIVLKGLMMGKSSREIDDAIPQIAEFTGLGEYLDMPLHTYSQGMALRLAFAITTTFSHEILVLDEWIGAGDAQFQEKVVARMNSVIEAAGICVIASHNNGLLRRTTEQCLWLEEGSERAFGKTNEVLEIYEAEVRAKLSDRIASQPAPSRIPIPENHVSIWLAPALDSSKQAGTIVWDVSAFEVRHIRLTVRPAEGADEQLVGTGPARGTRPLPSWVRPGMVFHLYDQQDNINLGSLRIG